MPFIQAFTARRRLRGWEKAPFTPPPFPCAIQAGRLYSGKNGEHWHREADRPRGGNWTKFPCFLPEFSIFLSP
jgi:hypothetical protein